MNNPYQNQILSHMLNLMKELLEKMIYRSPEELERKIVERGVIRYE